MCFNSLTTMQLAVYAFCGLHSLNVLLLPGYMVSTGFAYPFSSLSFGSLHLKASETEFQREFILSLTQRPSLLGLCV